MGFAQAFEGAGAIITLIGLIPVGLILLVMTQNMTNPEFDMTAAFTAGMESIVHAVAPAPILALLLAFTILLLRAEF